MPQNAVVTRKQASLRLDRLKQTSAFNVIGLPELIGLAGAALLALLAVFAYFYFYLPANSRLNSTELERQRLQGAEVEFAPAGDPKLRAGMQEPEEA